MAMPVAAGALGIAPSDNAALVNRPGSAIVPTVCPSSASTNVVVRALVCASTLSVAQVSASKVVV